MRIVKSAIKITLHNEYHIWFCLSDKKLYYPLDSYFIRVLTSNVCSKIIQHHKENGGEWNITSRDQDNNLNMLFECFTDPSKIQYKDCQIYSNLAGAHYVLSTKENMSRHPNFRFNNNARYGKSNEQRIYLHASSLYEDLKDSNIFFGTERNRRVIEDFELSLATKSRTKQKNSFTLSGECSTDGIMYPLCFSGLITLFIVWLFKLSTITIPLFVCVLLIYIGCSCMYVKKVDANKNPNNYTRVYNVNEFGGIE